MLSQRHESLLLLFRNRSTLAVESLSVKPRIKVPEFDRARIDSADLTDILPTEYRADLVVTLVGANGAAAMSIIVEAQLAIDERKRWVWPAYVANLRARLKCPVVLLVVTLGESVARWAAKPIELGEESYLVPVVLGPSEIAEITDLEEARAAPECSMLSIMAHGSRVDARKGMQIARAAWHAAAHSDEGMKRFYRDLVYISIGKNRKKGVDPMPGVIVAGKTYLFESERDREEMYLARARADGRAAVIIQLLTLRFGELSDNLRFEIGLVSEEALAAVAERLFTAKTLEECLGPQWFSEFLG